MDTAKQPLVSVIVPCYNGGPFLKETLETVIAQTYPSWECIIIDNNSTDNSKEIADAYAAKDPRFRSISQTIKGVSATRNKGIAASSGKYILPLDADDLIDRTYIEKAVNILETRPEVKVAYCEVEFFGEMTGKWRLLPFSMQRMLVENLIFCTALYRRSDYDQTNGYRESMVDGFEDWDFWLGFVRSEREVYRIPEVLFYYRIRKVSRNNALDEQKVKALRRQLYLNHKELYDSTIDLSAMIYDYYRGQADLAELLNSKSYLFGQRMWERRMYFVRKYERVKRILKRLGS